MHPVIPLWVTIVTTAANIIVPAVGWLAFRRVARRSAPTLVAPSFVFFALWVAVAFTLSARGFFLGTPDTSVPRIAFAFVPLAAGYLAYLSLRSVRAVVDQIPLHSMIGLQFYRALGFVFLVEWTLGALPGAFALPAGIGDIAIGLAAPWVAARVKSGAPRSRELAILWNVLGIADLAVAVTTGVLSTPGPLHLLALDNPNFGIIMLPLVLIPTIAVPFSILLHLIGLHRLVGRVQPMALGFSKAA
ncbi:MAG TPA: hypothetical protein VGO46_09940 [Gemmatimonadaceae bacterium]|nr:hypothetical protein [Gemmatimonadaceae bacterium]